MWFTHKSNIVRGLVGGENNRFVMEEKQVFSNIWVLKDCCRAGTNGPTECFIQICHSNFSSIRKEYLSSSFHVLSIVWHNPRRNP